MAAGALARDDRNGSAGSGEEGYRGPQVCSIVGITYRQLDYWARTGLLHPSISEATGSGSQRRYSYTDLVQLKVIKRLLDAGLSLQAARKAIACLRSSGDDLATANLVIDDGRSVLAYSGEEIIDLLQGGQTVLNIVPLGRVMSELETAITDLGLSVPDASPGSVDAAPAAAHGIRCRFAEAAAGRDRPGRRRPRESPAGGRRLTAGGAGPTRADHRAGTNGGQGPAARRGERRAPAAGATGRRAGGRPARPAVLAGGPAGWPAGPADWRVGPAPDPGHPPVDDLHALHGYTTRHPAGPTPPGTSATDDLHALHGYTTRRPAGPTPPGTSATRRVTPPPGVRNSSPAGAGPAGERPAPAPNGSHPPRTARTGRVRSGSNSPAGA